MENVSKSNFKDGLLVIMERNKNPTAVSQGRQNNLASTTEKMLQKSSIYAISQVGKSKSLSRRFLWIVVLIAALSGCSYEIYKFLMHYFLYPVVINLLIQNNEYLPFPAVTVCGLNRMKKEYMPCLGTNRPIKNCTDGPSNSLSGAGEFGVSASERIGIARCQSQLSGKTDHTKSKFGKFVNKYSHSDSERRRLFDVTAKEFIDACSFDQQHCSFENFSLFQNLHYGNCFTFNKILNNSSSVRSHKVGVKSGLTLVIELNPTQDIPVSQSSGVKVVIHHSVDDPNPEDGISVAPGQETSFSIKQVITRRLPPPYKDRCMDYTNMYRGRDECILFCIQEQNYASCSCIDPTLPHINDWPRCNINNVNDSCCLDNVLGNMTKKELPCDCPLPCEMISYKIIKSAALWPSRSSYLKSMSLSNRSLTEIRLSKTRIQIYYSTLEQKVFEQKAVFQNSELFSHLGSELGLWLGLSLAAAFELMENIIHLFRYCLTKH
ncbi:degenerin deg-1-like [Uloborus diversus]|uniref:degenerin deg-1-like n=1 Tax=Uloborus diversus TaxID=327109 RepID=UPI002409FD17|nr:degenerin deg-1-like [Uloborus diversus]